MMTPGVEIKKDAVVSFGGAETAAYIFLEVNPQNWEKGGTDMDFLAGKDVGKVHFSICDEWTFLEAKDGKYVYYIALEPNNTLSQQIIRDGKVFVDWNIRNSELQKLNDLALTFKATAVQTDGRTPEEMWALING